MTETTALPKPQRFVEEDKQFTASYSRQVFRTVLHAYAPYSGRLAVVLATGLCARTLLLYSANVVGFWADALCHRTASSLCRAQPLSERFLALSDVQFVRILVGLAAAGFVLNAFFRICIARIGTYAVANLHDEVCLRTSRLPLRFFDATPVGRIVSRFSTDYGAVFRMAGGPMGELLCLYFDLCIMAILIGVASPYYLPLVGVAVVANIWLYRRNLPRLREERRRLSVVRAPAIAHFAETSQGFRTIRVFGREDGFSRRFEVLQEGMLGQRARTARTVQGFALRMTALTASLLLVTGLFGLFLISRGAVSVGSLAVAFTFVTMTSSTIQQFFEYLANLEEALTGVERLDDYLRRDLEPGARLPPSARFPTGHPIEDAAFTEMQRARAESGTTTAVSPGAHLHVERLTLRYRKELPLVLNGLEFEVAAGERVGVVGRTGSGKSSLIQALFHLYPFTEGRVLVDGFAACLSDAGRPAPGEIPLHQFRRKFGLIPQEPTLFRGTVRENLTIEGASGNDDDVLALLERLGASEWLGPLSQILLGASVLERGANFSAGQRQLLCLARCILQRAPIIVFYEATSSVDPDTERVIVRALTDLLAGSTQLVVAHRLSTLETCHRILWLEGGRLREQGTPAEVLPRFAKSQARQK